MPNVKVEISTDRPPRGMDILDGSNGNKFTVDTGATVHCVNGHPLAGPIVIGVDNEAAIKICENQGVTARNKHFQDSIHYFRDMNARNYVVPTFVRTDVQHADGFTKPLARPQFLPWAERFVRP